MKNGVVFPTTLLSPNSQKVFTTTMTPYGTKLIETTDLGKSLRHIENFNLQLFNQANLFNRFSILYMFYFHVSIQQYKQMLY